MTDGFTAAFVKIEQFLSDQSPLALLSQLALTYLFVPSGEFQGESSETAEWERRIEFLTGYLLARPHPSGDFPVVTGHTLEAAKQLLDEYYHAVRMHLLPDVAGDAQVSPAETILRTAKFHSMHVRGEAYPHQFEQFAAELYGPHDPWLRQNLGFTIGEAIHLAAAIRREYERRNRSSKANAREESKAQTDALIADGQADEQNRRELELSIGCQLHYGNAENLLAFTLEELAEISGLSSETCQSFLNRMSQEFGYHNPQFPNTFTDALAAPWDYNALSERPLITHDGRHWLPLFPALRQALFNTFYFDLMADASYRPTFEKARGAYLETKTADYLRRFFPPDAVLLNPHKLNNEEFADVAVLHDGRILIVQCKSKTLTRPARIGADLEALRTDLRKAIQEAFQQGIVARDYLRSKDTPEIIVGNRTLAIDMSQVTAIYIVNVTLAPFQMLAARLANCNPALGLFAGNEYPWSLALGDFDILTQVLRSPATFLH